MRESHLKATVFLGGGRITAALIAGLRLARYKQPMIVHDRHPEKLRELSKRYQVMVEPDLQKALARANLLILAVRPASVADLLLSLDNVNRPLLAVSLAAGLPLSMLQSGVGPPVRWARAMPSPVCRVGQGLTGVAFPAGLPRRDRTLVRRFFANVGQVIEVPESQFDIFTAAYSSSHGYHALAMLAEAAESAGLDSAIAISAAAHALADGINSWRGSKVELHDLLQEAATPGGIAATVMSTMEKNGYGPLLQTALRAGVDRARANAATLAAAGLSPSHKLPRQARQPHKLVKRKHRLRKSNQ